MAKNSNLYTLYVSQRAKLAKFYFMSAEAIDQYINKNENEKEVLALLEFGSEIQTLQDGVSSASNRENKFYQKDMMAIWLYSLPLISKEKIVIQNLSAIIKPNRVYRFYSEGHVIVAFVNGSNQTIQVMDPNDEKGEQTFKMSDTKKIHNYLTERFSKIGQYLDSVNIFIPTDIPNNEFKPDQFEELKNLFFGQANSQREGSQKEMTFSVWLCELESVYQSLYAHKPNPASLLRSAIFDLNRYAVNIDDQYIQNFLTLLAMLKNDLKVSMLEEKKRNSFIMQLDFYFEYLRNIKEKFLKIDAINRLQVSMDYLIRNIQFIAMEHQSKSENNAFQAEFIQIEQLAKAYTFGSSSIEEIVSELINKLNVLVYSDKNLSGVFAWQLKQLEGLRSTFYEFQLKINLLQSISSEDEKNKFIFTRENGRNNLHAAAESSDMVSTAWFATHKYNINARGTHGNSPLAIAIQANNVNLCLSLIKYGANVNHFDDAGSSLIYEANTLNNPDILKLLLEKGLSKETLYNKKFGDKFISHNGIDLIHAKLTGPGDINLKVKIIEILLNEQVKRPLLDWYDCKNFTSFLIERKSENFIKFALDNKLTAAHKLDGYGYCSYLKECYDIAKDKSKTSVIEFLDKIMMKEEVFQDTSNISSVNTFTRRF